MDAQPKSRRAWPLRLAAKLGLSMLALLAGLGLAEIGIRLFADVKPPVLLVDREVGRRYRANHAAPLFNPESQQTVMLRFNDQGLRFPSVPLKKPAGTKRLLVIGDSMIAGLEVEEEHTAMARFQAAMNARAEGPRWEVLNFGVSGSGTGQQLTLYQHLGRKYQPDMVWLSFYPGNDLADNSTRLSKSRR